MKRSKSHGRRWSGLGSGRSLSDRGESAGHAFRPQFETLEQRLVLSTVVGRHLFYDNSAFDGNQPGISASDDLAIAPDKSAYLPNDSLAVFANVSSYSRGINGIMIDMAGPGGNRASIDGVDFVFRVGDNNAPGGWVAAPPTSGLTVRTNFDGSGTDRIEVTWPDGAIKNKWLEVQVRPTANTGLLTTDVFFFGNKVGDVGGPTATSFSTTAAGDATPIVAGGLGPAAGITDVRDIDRSNVITASGDRGAATSNIGAISRMQVELIAPDLSADLLNDTGPGGPNTDGITTDPTITGTLVEFAPISTFVATLNNGVALTNLLPLVQPNGEFTISQSLLDTMNGSPLPDGTHVVHLGATDADGLTSMAHVTFTLKRSIATPGAPDLLASSDTGTSSTDNITKINTPTFQIVAEVGSTLTLYANGVPVGSQVVGASPVQIAASTLGDGVRSMTARAVDGAGNVSSFSAALAVTIDTIAPALTVSTLVTFSDDLTPHVTVTESTGLANGTQIRLDVDINNDGDFDDSGELSRTLSTLYNGSRYFELTPALPPTDPIDGPYLVKLRARATDVAGNEGSSALSSLRIDTLSSNALASYVAAADPNPALPSIAPAATPTISGTGYTVYVFDFKSQTWRSPSEVNKTEWQHWLQIIVPTAVTKTTALMYITGGSTGGQPTTINSDRAAFGAISAATGMISVILPNVPNQPLDFAPPIDPPGVTRSEDDIIAYSFIKFLETGDPNWIALLPMVKSAVKAMDAVIGQVPIIAPGKVVNDFIVTGGSKRGWTTWLTGAVDSRVKAVIPAVIDLLNLDESMVHHYGFYGFFSQAVQDYQEGGFNLIQNSLMEANQEIGRIVDPYRYLDNSNLTNIPKLILNSTGDEFFVPDSSQFYWTDIPGPKYLRYIPNTGHGLDSRATDSILTFTNAQINNLPLPEYSWSIDPDGQIRVQTVTAPSAVRLWKATNGAGREFRQAAVGNIYSSSDPTALINLGGGAYVSNVAMPAAPAATAFMIELEFPSPIPGVPYVFTTQVQVFSQVPLVNWPFYMPTNPSLVAPGSSLAAVALGNDDRNDLAFGIAAPLTSDTEAAANQSNGGPPEVVPVVEAAHAAPVELPLDDWAWIDDGLSAIDADSDTDVLDAAMAEIVDELLLPL